MPEFKLPLRFLTGLVALCVVGVVVSFGGAIYTVWSEHRAEATYTPQLGAPSLGAPATN